MILLDEIDDEPLQRKGSPLPPYSPGRSVELLPSKAPLASNVLANSQHSRSTSHPISRKDLPQHRLDHFSISSIQTPVPPERAFHLSSASSNASQTSLPRSVASTAFAHLDVQARSYKRPSNVGVANYVHIERNSAPITGSYVIDPTLHVPDFLLPDESGIKYINERKGSKGKDKKSNLNFLTNSGNISADVWICGNFSRPQKNTSRDQGHYHGASRSGDLETRDGFLPSEPALRQPRKDQSPVDIDIWSDSGSIMLRIHAAINQRVRIRLHAGRGSISVGIPHSFLGYIYVRNSHIKYDSAEDTNSNASSPTSGHFMRKSNLSSQSFLGERGKHPLSIIADMDINLMGLKAPLRHSVRFSKAMDGLVEAQLERRRDVDSQYFLGYSKRRSIDGLGGGSVLDELFIEGSPGAIDIFFNDEYYVTESHGFISRLFSRHGTLR